MEGLNSRRDGEGRPLAGRARQADRLRAVGTQPALAAADQPVEARACDSPGLEPSASIDQRGHSAVTSIRSAVAEPARRDQAHPPIAPRPSWARRELVSAGRPTRAVDAHALGAAAPRDHLRIARRRRAVLAVEVEPSVRRRDRLDAARHHHHQHDRDTHVAEPNHGRAAAQSAALRGTGGER